MRIAALLPPDPLPSAPLSTLFCSRKHILCCVISCTSRKQMVVFLLHCRIENLSPQFIFEYFVISVTTLD
jgi:hypothetical protein